MAHGEGKRNKLRAEALERKLAQTAQAQLAGEAEVLCIIDGSDLRKRYATSLEHLDQVRDLEGELVAGYLTMYLTMNVLGIGTSGKRALLYHRLYSSCAPSFKSHNREIAETLRQSHERLKVAGVKRWVVVADREFDDAKVYQQLSLQGKESLLLLTSLSVVDEASAIGVVQGYMRRWAVKETLAWTKQFLGWEAVRVLEFEGADAGGDGLGAGAAWGLGAA